MDRDFYFNGRKYTIEGGYSGDAPEIGYVRRIESIDSKIDEMAIFASDKLLDLYNTTWVDENHEKMSRGEFIRKMSYSRTYIYEEEDLSVTSFDDGGMFSGHSIRITIDGGEICHAEF